MSQRQVYKKKGEPDPTSQEETKGEHREHHEHGHRGRGRGGRGGRGGRFEDRPKTHREENRYVKKGEVHEENGNQSHPEGGHRQRRERRDDRDVDKNSYTYKFHNENFPRPEKVQVTIDTEIPESIPKEQRKKEPNKNEFEKKMKELDDKIHKLKDEINKLKDKKKVVKDGGKVGDTNLTFKEVKDKRFETKNELNAQRKELYRKIDEITHKLEQLEREKAEAKKMTSKDLKNADEIQKEIANKMKQYETTSLSKENERKVLKEVEFLKKSLKYQENLDKIEPQIKSLKDEKRGYSDKAYALRQEIDSVQVEIDKIKADQNEQMSHQGEVKKQLDTIDKDIDKFYETLKTYYAEKDQVREEYFKGKWEYQVEKLQVDHIERMRRDKQRLIDEKEYKAKKLEERKQNILNRPNPYQREIDTCEHLISICQKMQINLGLVEIQDEAKIQEERKDIINQLAKEDVAKKVNDGKIERVKTKAEREAEQMLVVGGKKKGKGKSKKVAQPPSEKEIFNIDINTINKFGLLKVSPPMKAEDLEGKVKELQQKQEEFQKEGQKKLDEEEEKLEAMDEDNYEEPEYEKKDDREHRDNRDNRDNRGFRGGRGGRGDRGDRDNRDNRGFRGGRGGRGGRDFEPREKREKYEFEADDDEEEDYRPQRQHQNRGRGAKRENLNMDDQSFPTL